MPRLRRYLLGTLPEDEQHRLEEAYFRDEALFAELLEVAEDLAEAGKRGELSRSERAAFDRRVLACGQWRERLQVTKGLETLAARAHADLSSETAAAPAADAPPHRLRWALAALGTAAAVLAVLMVRSGGLPPPGPQQARSSPAVPGPSSLANETPAARPESPARTVDLVLTAAAFRDGGNVPVLHLGAGVAWVRLSLPLERGRHERHEAVLRTVEGTRVLSVPVERDTTGSARLIAPVPAVRLPPGDYILTLSGSTAGRRPEDIADYYFRVAPR